MNLASTIALAALTLATVGCGASTTFEAESPAELPARRAERVEVLLDQAPARPFRAVGKLTASTLESPLSIRRMREAAARSGLDGIYWIDCEGQSGRCSAVGFVYVDGGAPEPIPGSSVPVLASR